MIIAVYLESHIVAGIGIKSNAFCLKRVLSFVNFWCIKYDPFYLFSWSNE